MVGLAQPRIRGRSRCRRRPQSPSVTGMSLLRGLVCPRTWLAFTHHVAGMVLAVVSFAVVVAGFAVGLALTPVGLVGLPVMGIAVRFSTALGAVERRRFELLLGQAV